MKQINDTINVLSTELRRNRRDMASQSPLAFAKVYMKNNCNEPFSQMHEEMFGVISARLHEMIYFHWYLQLWPAHSV